MRSDELVELLDAIPDVVLVVGRDRRILHVNAAAHTVLGWPPGELVGQSLQVLIPHDRRAVHRDLFTGYMNAPESRRMAGRGRLKALRRDGTMLDVDIELKPRPNRGDVVAVVRDISALRDAEQGLQTTVMDLERANLALQDVISERNRILGVAAHDLRNPLGTILVLVDSLLTGTSRSISSDQREMFEVITDSITTMRDLVNDMLALARAGTGSLQLEREETDLPELVRRACRLLEPLARPKDISLVRDVPPIFPLALVDPAKVRQVVHNLVGNAIKFTLPGRQVRVELKRDGDHACLAVHDQGPGLAPGERERIFRPFERGSSRPTGGETSTGLGLAIVRRIVDGHGGTISVAEAPGGGATFEVCLPLHAPEPELHTPWGDVDVTEGDLPAIAWQRGSRLALLVHRLLGRAPMAALLVDDGGIIRIANEHAHVVFGYPPGKLDERALGDVLPPEEPVDPDGPTAAPGDSKDPWALAPRGLVRGRHVTGRAIPLEVSFGTVDVDGRSFALVVAIDLSERMAARRQADEAIERLESGSVGDRIVEASNLGLVVCGPDGEVLYANGSGRRMLDELGEVSIEALAGATRGRPCRLPSARDGSTRVFEGWTRPMDWDGRSAWLIELEDVTERERLQDKLITIEKLGLVGQLASDVAHDFNNLLAKIQGALELARAEAASVEQVTRLAEIERSVELGAELTGRLLFLSRRAVGNVGPVDMRSVVRDIEPLMRQLVPKEIMLRLHLPQEVAAVHGDPVQLEQVVMNLVTNARDACIDTARRGAAIDVRVRTVAAGQPVFDDERAEPDVSTERVVLVVEDTGTGIPEQDLDRIFDPFFTTRNSGRGTGLGLASVLAVVERRGGRIDVDSAPEQGTRMTVVLRRIPAEGTVWSGSGSSPTVGPGHTVLVVDDEPAIRRILAQHLRADGLNVIEAATAVEALQLVRDVEVLDLLVTDLVMPEVDGWMLTRQVRAAFPGVPVLLTTGYGHDVLRSHGVDEADAEILTKPFRLAEARQRIMRILKRGERSKSEE